MRQPAGPGEDRGYRVGGGRAALLVLAIVPRHGAVRGFGFQHLAVGRGQHRGHQPERAETLCHDIRLHVAVVVLAGPDITARPLERSGYHVVDQPVLIGELLGFERRLELPVEDFLENILEATVIDLENRVLGRKIEWIAAIERVVHRGAGEIADRVVEIVHRHRYARGRCLEHFVLDGLAVVAYELDGELALAGEAEVGGAVLVAIGVAADDDRLGPAGHQARHVFADDRFAEDDAAEDVADRAVGRAVHLLQIEFFDARLVGRDSRALDRDADLFGHLGRIDRDLVVGLVAIFDAEVVIEQLDIEIGVDQLLLDELPNDARHLVAVHLDDGILDLDLGHGFPGKGLERVRNPRRNRGRGPKHRYLGAAGAAIALLAEGRKPTFIGIRK